MKVLRYKSQNWKTGLARQIPPGTDVTVMHLGRGGVMEDGSLDPYNTGRVLQTLAVASDIENLRPRTKVQILWTGGHNRKQDRSGAQPPASEAGAAYQYACTTVMEEDNFTMQTEEDSTSTVENATASAKLVPADNTIVVVTDPLHYLARKVQFIFWLTFPHRRVVFVELLASPPGTDWKSQVKHLISTTATIVGMLVPPVTRGDSTGIQRRQAWLQKYTVH